MSIRPGTLVPQTKFGELEGDVLRVRTAGEIFDGRSVIVIGVPAPFSPICTRVHLQAFIRLAPQVRAAGYDELVCMAGSSPWVLAAWAREIDPAGAVRFLSDGNLSFGRACSLTTVCEELFLGTALTRFTMTVTDGLIQRLAVEQSPLSVTCSSAEAVLARAA